MSIFIQTKIIEHSWKNLFLLFLIENCLLDKCLMNCLYIYLEKQVKHFLSTDKYAKELNSMLRIVRKFQEILVDRVELTAIKCFVLYHTIAKGKTI